MMQKRSMSLEKEAYHGSAFMGDDIQAVMDPAAAARMCTSLHSPPPRPSPTVRAKHASRDPLDPQRRRPEAPTHPPIWRIERALKRIL